MQWLPVATSAPLPYAVEFDDDSVFVLVVSSLVHCEKRTLSRRRGGILVHGFFDSKRYGFVQFLFEMQSKDFFGGLKSFSNHTPRLASDFDVTWLRDRSKTFEKKIVEERGSMKKQTVRS